MVHRGVRRECPECGKVLSDLWKHMRTVHGQYRRRAKIPKDNVAGSEGKNGTPTTPSKSSSDAEVSPKTSPQVKPTPISNNNTVGKKVSGGGGGSAKNKRKSSPPVKVKMAFNFSKSSGKKPKLGKS